MEPEDTKDLPGMSGPWPPLENFNSPVSRIHGFLIYLLSGFSIGVGATGWLFHILPAHHASQVAEAAIGAAFAVQSILVVLHRIKLRRLRKRPAEERGA